MLAIGISGGPDLITDNKTKHNSHFHDGAAVLMDNGVVIAAIEEERLNRIKHSNKFPISALRFCLESHGVGIPDIGRFALYNTEQFWIRTLQWLYPEQKFRDAKAFIAALIESEFKVGPAPDRIVFVGHHMAHAVSAFGMSGFSESLVLAVDAMGDWSSGLIARGVNGAIQEIETLSSKNSLGQFYLNLISGIGYRIFDEYKVMGLAPYGDPAAYRDVLSRLYALLPNGQFQLDLQLIPKLEELPRRKSGQPLTQQHKDFAASLQEALENILFHVVRHYRESTGSKNLCMAGGVAHNCSMTGRLLYSGLFHDIFVQPAASDAGCALGAALTATGSLPRQVGKRLQHVYWGSDIGAESQIETALKAWSGFLTFEKTSCVAERTAKMIEEGAVVGWVQGRSEFGPRALGNRSILADPRPADNKERINAMVKKRESFRPFAPSVLEEQLKDFFDVPSTVKSLPFMTFVTRVREEKRKLLGAVTHVDGTARVQTVSRHDNDRYWALITEFNKLTGVPMLLNTSFNNNVEPIVDSTADAIVCFLTTGLDYLVVGDFIVKKCVPTLEDWQRLRVFLPPYVKLEQTKQFVHQGWQTTAEIVNVSDRRISSPVSIPLFRALVDLERASSLLFVVRQANPENGSVKPLLDEINSLWASRLISLAP